MEESLLLRLLYRTAPGRLVLKGLVHPGVSRLAGKILSSPLSRPMIRPYIKKHHIPMTGYEGVEYRSFNDFFTRRRLPQAMEVDQSSTCLISPCDGLLSVYPIDANSRFRVKGSEYTLTDLLEDRDLAGEYQGGTCLIFRLTPRHYHRYCYIDDGHKGDNRIIPGVLHSVRPICCECYPVYIRNSREYTVLYTEHFGAVVQMEVGALLVGRISNEHGRGRIRRGHEKGHFEFGGSTILLLFKSGSVSLEAALFAATARGQDRPVRLGEVIGKVDERP